MKKNWDFFAAEHSNIEVNMPRFLQHHYLMKQWQLYYNIKFVKIKSAWEPSLWMQQDHKHDEIQSRHG